MAVTETGHLASREIDELYRRHGGEVYRYAYAVLGNHSDAEDVTQTTFLNAYRALEQGVRPRKPSNWLLTIASNAIKQRFRHEQARPREVELDDRLAGAESDDDGPSVGELLTALSKIPPQQRQAIVLREFEGRSYAEIAEILGVTTTALETLLFRARRSLAEELEHQLSCTEAQLAVSRSVDDRLGRKERRRLRDHLTECPDCAQFARLQQRHRTALRGLMLIPIPLSLTLFKGLEGAGTATAATMPASMGVSAAAVGTGVGTGAGATAAAGGGAVVGGVALKAAAVVAAVGVASGVAVTGASEIDSKPGKKAATAATQPGQRLGQVAPRGVSVPGNGVARGKLTAPGQLKGSSRSASALAKARARARAEARAHARQLKQRSAIKQNHASSRGQQSRTATGANATTAHTNSKPAAKKTATTVPQAKPTTAQQPNPTTAQQPSPTTSSKPATPSGKTKQADATSAEAPTVDATQPDTGSPSANGNGNGNGHNAP
jgi:RNA polymerase sigma factor (sigma-70 family)